MKNVKADKKSLTQFRQSLLAPFKRGENIRQLMRAISQFSDKALLNSWTDAYLHEFNETALIVHGSLGRHQLLPHSDLDILVLHHESDTESLYRAIEIFLQALWDKGFNLGHQVATIDEYIPIIDTEITVLSSLMDMRLLTGSLSQFTQLRYAIAPHQTWPSQDYFRVKWKEQIKRHQRYNETAYNLEPNIKNGPGGLRCLQMTDWIAKRQLGANYIDRALALGLISQYELALINSCNEFLWRVRFALHMLADKDENRILFNHQKELTEILGYQQKTIEGSIESFMKNYYRVSKSVREMNELILQLFREHMFQSPKTPIKKLNEHFQITNRYLEVRATGTFKHHPETLFSLFLYLNQTPAIKGVRGSTIRLIKHNRYLIDGSFRRSKTVAALFIQLLKDSPNVFGVLDRMNRYGLLARYIPEFQTVIGQMQYDLFHIYTVDQHSLFVVKNLMRMLHAPKNSILHFQLIKKIKHIELLYIAALFHDIGKGRGGCHSTLGAIDAKNFCIRHQLPEHQQELVSWLVQHHLLFSITAQRKDIYELDTIKEFCVRVDSEDKLNYLYLLTIADIQATNPTLWTTWKESLLTTLYHKALLYLQDKNPKSDSAVMKECQLSALNILPPGQAVRAKKLWGTFKPAYFIHQKPNTIAKQTQSMLQSETLPVVLVSNNLDSPGTTLFTFGPHAQSHLLVITTIMSNLNLNIVEANISTTHDEHGLDSFIFLDKNNKKLTSNTTINKLISLVKKHLSTIDKPVKLTRHFQARRVKHARLKPSLQFVSDFTHQRTQLILKASDKKGLLATLAKIFKNLEINLLSAKIITTGEEVEDSFYLTGRDNRTLNQRDLSELEAMINKKLS